MLVLLPYTPTKGSTKGQPGRRPSIEHQASKNDNRYINRTKAINWGVQQKPIAHQTLALQRHEFNKQNRRLNIRKRNQSMFFHQPAKLKLTRFGLDRSRWIIGARSVQVSRFNRLQEFHFTRCRFPKKVNLMKMLQMPKKITLFWWEPGQHWRLWGPFRVFRWFFINAF